MIYICADDYGLCAESTEKIQRCIDSGILDKVSVFPNMEPIDFGRLWQHKKTRVALHVNLIEGKCMADAGKIDLLAEKDGNFKHAFYGLFLLNLFRRKALEDQVYQEIRAQVRFFKSLLPDGEPFCIDSHQHIHMIPGVFNALLRVLQEEKIQLTYMRIPAEPLLPYLKMPSLYLTYSPINLLKQWLLNFLWLLNRKQAAKYHIPTAYFMGILFSGHMEAGKVSKVLPAYAKLAEKDGRDIEVLFHPGYLERNKPDYQEKNIVFEKFYLSKHRKTEFDAVINMQKEGCNNVVH